MNYYNMGKGYRRDSFVMRLENEINKKQDREPLPNKEDTKQCCKKYATKVPCSQALLYLAPYS